LLGSIRGCRKSTWFGWNLVFILFLVSRIAAAPVQRKPAETVVVNARIYTVNPQQPWAQAVAIRDGKIVAVGTAKEIAGYRGKSTHVIDAQGRVVLPGFTDCHVHFMDGSLGLTRVVLDGAKTVAEIQKRVKEYADSHPNAPWITGMGWSYPTFGESGMPDKKILDEIVPDRPVFLEAFDGHSSWANSKALAAAGINRSTEDPLNGTIVRDEKGEPTGALKESAGDLVRKQIPQPTRADRLDALQLGMHEANRFGLTRVHSAGGDFEYVGLFDSLHQLGKLTLRFYIAYFLDPPGMTFQKTLDIAKVRQKYHDDWVSGSLVKIMLDGVVETHTAAMLAPYSDDPSQSGKLFWKPEDYKLSVTKLDRRGIQLFTHAIGDRAVRLALDAYQEAAEQNHSVDMRHRIEHIENVSPDDIPRFGKLGVIASFQPLHADPDEDTLNIWARNVGPERAQRAWAWKSIQDAGGHIAFGSDWPVVTLNPWPGIQTAMTRQTEGGNPPEGFVPAQRLTLADAIKGYTLGAAYAGRREKTEGSIQAGKLADLIILSQDVFKTDPKEVGKTEVLLTMVGGDVVYQSPKFTSSDHQETHP